MENKRRLLLVVPLVALLSSCLWSKNTNTKDVNDVKVNMYSFIKESESQNLEDYKVKEYTFKSYKDEPEVLYTSLEGFVSLFENRFVEGVTNQVTNLEWASYNSDGQTVFYFGIDLFDENINIGGSLSPVLKSETDLSKSSLYLGLNETGRVMVEGSNISTYSFSELGFDSFYYGGVAYFSLSLLSLATSIESDISYFYDYQSLYQFDDVSKLSTFEFLQNEQSYTIYSKMSQYVSSTYNNQIPKNVLKERNANVYFLFTNLYGLGGTKGIKDMKTYLDNLTYVDDLENKDPIKNDNALYRLIRDLNDGHTTLTTDNAPYQKGDDQNPRSPMWMERMSLRINLAIAKAKEFTTRTPTPTGAYLSADAKVGYISLDGFSFIYNAYNEDGSINPEIYKKDSFFKLYSQLVELKSFGTVEKVVIDITTNGGGTVGVLLKILALMNRENTAEVHFHDIKTGEISALGGSVDSNLDGKCDAEDIFGDDFTFYIYTSSFSFSCANALPFIAQKMGIAKIIGQTSGGGECSVSEHVLCTGENVYHSSNNHIGWYTEEKGFQGDENGATPDTSIAMVPLYDIEAIEEFYLQ